jgi:hypothetical protein
MSLNKVNFLDSVTVKWTYVVRVCPISREGCRTHLPEQALTKYPVYTYTGCGIVYLLFCI